MLISLYMCISLQNEIYLVPQHSSALSDFILPNLALCQMTNRFPGEYYPKSEILESIMNSTL